MILHLKALAGLLMYIVMPVLLIIIGTHFLLENGLLWVLPAMSVTIMLGLLYYMLYTHYKTKQLKEQRINGVIQ